MNQTRKLKNGLTLITVPLDHIDSVTTLIAVGAGSRYENKFNSGLSHFLEHMAFKGTKKYPSAEIISTTIDRIGAINNAFTDRENTVFWIKSSGKNIELSSDILSSMIKESLLSEDEIEREKGVIIEEMKMYHDDPMRYIWNLYYNLQFGATPLGMDIIGNLESIKSLTRTNFVDYMNSLYVPENLVLVYAGKLPKNVDNLAEKYFSAINGNKSTDFVPYISKNQKKSKVDLYYRDVNQSQLILGVESYSRIDKKRFAAKILSAILGGGMSSRLFIQVRERRGLAYYIGSIFDPLIDTGYFAIAAGLRLADTEEGLKVILDEIKKVTTTMVGSDELIKAKEMIRGRIAISMESTNFLAESFGIDYILDKQIMTFEQYLKNIDSVTKQDILYVANELFMSNKFNLQLIAPLKSKKPFEDILEQY